MHADSSATIKYRWLYLGLICGVLLLGSRAACGEAYQAQDEGLHSFFSALSVPLGQPVVVSQAVARRQVSGVFDFAAPQQVLETLAGRESLIWHSDGQVLHLYEAAEARSSAVALRHISVDKLRRVMRRAGLDESRYPLRENGARTFYVYGPPNYVEHVLRLAQLVDRPRRKAPENTLVLAVVQVVNLPVEDRQHGVDANQVRVAGMASLIQARLSNEQKGQLADGSLALMAYPDTNSLLVKGKPAQVSLIKKWVAELDVATALDDVSSWRAGVSRDPLQPATALSPLTAAQHERVQRAFLRTDPEFFP